MLLRIINGHALLQVFPGQHEFTQKDKGGLQSMVSLQQKVTVVISLGESQKLLSQLAGSLELRPHVVKSPKCP